MAVALQSQPLSLELPADVKSAGIVVDDHQRLISALLHLSPHGLPERAVDKRRAEFLAGRYVAQSALQKLGLHALPQRNDDGSPRWPNEVVGSITHGAVLALSVVAWRAELRGVGIDAEELMSPEVRDELKQRIVAPRELGCLSEALGLPEHELTSLAFSAKESLYKCLYPQVGRFMDFHAARVVAVSGNSVQGQLIFELAVDWSTSLAAGRRFEALFHKGPRHVETAVLLRP